MKVTKFAHACLLVEEQGVRILLDPGSWNALPEVPSLDAILITHNHQDHCDTAQIKELLAQFPNAVVYTHEEARKTLSEAGIASSPIRNGETLTVNGVTVESFGTTHAIIYGEMPKCQNTGYLIAEKLFVPGDALHDVPSKPVIALALPTGGPWMKLSEALDYAKNLKPKIAFPIHDAMNTETYRKGLVNGLFGNTLRGFGTIFEDFSSGPTIEV